MNRGFSLIELLITIAVIAFIAFIALPLTSNWINGPDVTQTQTSFLQAFSVAKNTAIREGLAVNANGATSAICLITTNNKKHISVRTQTGKIGDANRLPANCNANNFGAEILNISLRPDVAITYGQASKNFSCACFTANGELTTSALNCAPANCLDSSASTNSRFIFSKGDINENVTIF